MSRIEHMPCIRLVPTHRIVFHEHPESRRTERLTERIRHDQVLRNPPIVADLKDGHYLLLDGANRVSGMRILEYSHVPVQVVDYGDESTQLKGWHHLLIQGRGLNLLNTLKTLPEIIVEPVSESDIEQHLELHQVLAIFVDESASGWGLFPRESGRRLSGGRRVQVLDRVVSLYEGHSDLERIKLADFANLPDVIRTVEHQLFLFPCFHKEELLELARERILIPTGITRHLIPGRALGLNLQLAFLLELNREEEKLSHFQAYLERLEIHGRIRFYEESVFIMNE
jgi:hypothetical protein